MIPMIASIDANNVVKLINLQGYIHDYSDKVKSELKKVWPSYSKSRNIKSTCRYRQAC